MAAVQADARRQAAQAQAERDARLAAARTGGATEVDAPVDAEPAAVAEPIAADAAAPTETPAD